MKILENTCITNTSCIMSHNLIAYKNLENAILQVAGCRKRIFT